MNIKKHFIERTSVTNKALKVFIKVLHDVPPILRKSMLYSLSAGGKRLRPVLLIATYEIFGGKKEDVLPAACAIEMIHTYSLIHDDLPSLDNDDLRRGKPTNHKVFGEALAVLAGDALLTNAFTVLGHNAETGKIKEKNVFDCMRILAKHAGAGGMVGGQTADLQAEGFLHGKKRSVHLSKTFLKRADKLLNYIHLHKTADLICASVEMGAVLASASLKDFKHLSNYARCIGLAFQIVDDVLDIVGDKKKLGKKGSDARNKKLTYVSLFGIEESNIHAASLISKAHEELDKVSGSAKAKEVLHEIADFIMKRDK
ncbi:MAG: polyprenyl synthetase family protein [Elusimicrobia bacterium]|nr:polyprenyl synthetase family protein [Elusimicrobiota bacterium]